jgi:L-Lysine epsilon oxidase N-terminal/L-lysine epsilon oxidase C-terminal domain
MVNPFEVASVAVHPGIGIARVGNALGPDDFFFGPEVPGAGPNPGPGGFRNEKKELKRQAARFRIYATLKSGEVVELTAHNATIVWRVQLANLKAGWYRFTTAMDLPRNLAMTSTRRNPALGVDDTNNGFLVRAQLDITPLAKTISGPSQTSSPFDDGKFFDTPVYLGELRTDEKGRLIVLGGRGATGANPSDKALTTFANNDGWHDDISDGPVRATVTIGDRAFEAEPGYVVVTPPNFGPGLFGVVTMDDVAREAFYAAGYCTPPNRASFTNEIWPLFDRLTGNQWVNHGLFLLHGKGSPLDARDPAVVRRLADGSDGGRLFREAVFKLFRDPGAYTYKLDALPSFYGDGVDYGFPPVPPDAYDASANLALTPTLWRMMKQWAAGEFVSDWTDFPTPPEFDSLPTSEQPRALDRANLYDILGGPFHPGIELTWILRQPRLWKAVYRLNVAAEGTRTRQDFGPELTPEICLGPNGPLSETGAGALTRWMGVPWQTDGGSCASGGDYTPTLYLSVPSFWGARVPNDVLPQAAYKRLNALGVSSAQRAKHFARRAYWYRLVQPMNGFARAKAMVVQWPNLGIVEPVRPPPDYEDVFHVEVAPLDPPEKDATLDLIAAVEQLSAPAATVAAVSAPAAPVPTERKHKAPRIHYRRDEV